MRKMIKPNTACFLQTDVVGQQGQRKRRVKLALPSWPRRNDDLTYNKFIGARKYTRKHRRFVIPNSGLCVENRDRNPLQDTGTKKLHRLGPLQATGKKTIRYF